MFIRIRTINGKQYRYQEERYREGGKVRSRSKSLGPVGDGMGFIRRQFNTSYGLDWDAIARQTIERMNAEDKAHAAREARIFLDIGLSVPPPSAGVPIEKPPTVVDLSAPAAQPTVSDAAEESAPPDGEAEGQ